MSKTKVFKPMLADTCEDISTLKFPVLASPKLDGVRALVIDGQLMSRSLRPIPNLYAQELFSGLPEGTDGELILGDPTAKNVYRDTVSAVMRQEGEPTKLHYFVFDNFHYVGGFEDRFFKGLGRGLGASVRIVPHVRIPNSSALEFVEEDCLKQGYEGVMVRSLDGPYKCGRSTEKEGYLLKIKRFKDAEAVVTGTYEQMHNENEAETNALGRTERSTKQEGLVGAGILGGLEVKGINGEYTGVDFRVGTGFDLLERQQLWKQRRALLGKVAKFKYFPSGSKDKPRFPTFLGWRDKIDQ